MGPALRTSVRGEGTGAEGGKAGRMEGEGGEGRRGSGRQARWWGVVDVR